MWHIGSIIVLIQHIGDAHSFKISRIRSFYMRKVAFTRDAFNEKLETILADFPILDVRRLLLLLSDRLGS